jgi:hypothetical protein
MKFASILGVSTTASAREHLQLHGPRAIRGRGGLPPRGRIR